MFARVRCGRYSYEQANTRRALNKEGRMKIATVDLETYWSATHSLSKMSPIKYCMHPDTEIISCGFKFGDGPTEVIFGEQQVIEYARHIDWSEYWVVGHNLSAFDAMILSWRMKVKPRLWGCTLAMARPIHAKDVGLALGKLVAHYGLGVKNQSALVQTRGKRLADFTPDEVTAMKRYNTDDVDQCYGLLRKLIPQTSRREIMLIDMTIRMLVEPAFETDFDLLCNTHAQEAERKKAVLRELGELLWNDVPTRAAMKIIEGFDPADTEEVKKTLMSASKFKKLLEMLGVEVPMKESPITGNMIPALSKTDEAFLDMQEHPNRLVAAAASARLDAKSTLLQTRIVSFLDAGSAHPENKLPVPLKYYGADTTGRWSGWAYNPQNLPRVNPKNPKASDALRQSLRAPKGYKVVVADQSGIELRVNMFLWKVPYATELFTKDPENADLYKYFAANELYNIEEADVQKPQRQVGKVAHLGLGFGAGPPTFQKVARVMGGVDMDIEESQRTVYAYRDAHPEIVRGWKTCHRSLEVIRRGAVGAAIDPWGMITPIPEGLQTPKGVIRYPDLRVEPGDDGRSEFVYGQGRHKARIYAGKVDENIVQHLARNVIADNALDVWKQTDYRPALTVHDELVYVAPDNEADDLLYEVQKVMRTPPSWWPELATWSEGETADTYGDAK